VFDLSGKHLRTQDALTGAHRYEFGYDSTGDLATIKDVDSLVTTIERDVKGNPTAIIAPFGQRTSFVLNDSGYIATITNPANESTNYTYSTLGLMQTMRDAKGQVHTFTYDSNGYLINDEDPAGGFKTLSRIDYEDGFEVTMRTAMGRTTKYYAQRLETGGTRMIDTDEAGLQTTTIMQGGLRTIITPDSTVTTIDFKPNPLYGMLAPLSTVTTKTPGGLISTISDNRTVLSMSGMTVMSYLDSVDVNGRTYKTMYNGDQRLLTRISPEERINFSWLDDKGRIVKDSVSGIDAIEYTYNPQGFLIQVSQSKRATYYNYSNDGWIYSIIDPMRRTTRFFSDSVGRVVRQSRNDGNDILYLYDPNSNLISLSLPGSKNHSFGYTSVDLTQKYTPPVLNNDTMTIYYTYNLDRELLALERANSRMIRIEYDSIGLKSIPRLNLVSFDRGILEYLYDSSNGNFRNIISPSQTQSIIADTLVYCYDGLIPIGMRYTGEINGSTRIRYDNDYRIVSESINDIDSVIYRYDNDGLLLGVGPLSLQHDPQNGQMIIATMDNINTVYKYFSNGELSGIFTSFNGNPFFVIEYTPDTLGRILRLTENIQGVSIQKRYTYDMVGRLREVYHSYSGGDSLVVLYYYDSNGNRDSVVTPNGVMRGIYDAQDRMLRYDNVEYVYTRNGELCFKIEGMDTTRYVYDDFDNLSSVILPTGMKIEYMIDGQNRRIGRKVNDVVTNRWIYSGQLNPVAEIDSVGNITARYVYATHINVPDYIIKNNITYRLITDHLGSVRFVMNSQTGEIVQKIDYDEYGNILVDTNPGFTPFGFAGGMYDIQTKLVRFGARDYDSYSGRWTTKDPIRFESGVSNLYEYVLNDPINLVDPNGEQLIITVRNGIGPYSSTTYVFNGLIPSVYTTNTIGDNGKELKEGIYLYKFGKHPLNPQKGKQQYPALNLYTLDSDRNMPATQNNCDATINGLNVHKGNTKGRKNGTGSKGCHVLQPKDWPNYIDEFQPGATGFYIYIRLR
jgi:RHS repeat-associated protein